VTFVTQKDCLILRRSKLKNYCKVLRERCGKYWLYNIFTSTSGCCVANYVYVRVPGVIKVEVDVNVGCTVEGMV